MAYIPAIPTDETAALQSNYDCQLQRDAYAATVTLTVTNRNTIHMVGLLTGACTYNILDTNAVDGCVVQASFIADGSGQTITWGANIAPITATLALAASEGAAVTFIYDATVGIWSASE